MNIREASPEDADMVVEMFNILDSETKFLLYGGSGYAILDELFVELQTEGGCDER